MTEAQMLAQLKDKLFSVIVSLYALRLSLDKADRETAGVISGQATQAAGLAQALYHTLRRQELIAATQSQNNGDKQ